MKRIVVVMVGAGLFGMVAPARAATDAVMLYQADIVMNEETFAFSSQVTADVFGTLDDATVAASYRCQESGAGFGDPVTARYEGTGSCSLLGGYQGEPPAELTYDYTGSVAAFSNTAEGTLRPDHPFICRGQMLVTGYDPPFIHLRDQLVCRIL